MEKLTFRQCTLTLLDRQFGLRRAFVHPTLDQWLTTKITLDKQEIFAVERLQQLLLLNSDAWNEQELAMHFIGPILSLVQFTEPYRFNLFAERKIQAIVPSIEGDVELSGEPDGIIATGYREPEIPMFAFSEYKRQLDPTGDPAGQALAAMLVGQTLNKNQFPVYGAYVVGTIWRFLLLDGKDYLISRDFSAVSTEVRDILRILKALKEIIYKLTA